MIEWITDYWEALTWSKILFGILLFIVSGVIGYGAIMLVMIKIPADYFSSQYVSRFQNDKRFLVRWGATIFKNVLGVILVILGLIMSIPTVPGPGLLTILLGLIMIDIPGKRPLESRLLKRPAILATINNLRLRHNKPPLIVD